MCKFLVGVTPENSRSKTHGWKPGISQVNFQDRIVFRRLYLCTEYTKVLLFSSSIHLSIVICTLLRNRWPCLSVSTIYTSIYYNTLGATCSFSLSILQGKVTFLWYRLRHHWAGPCQDILNSLRDWVVMFIIQPDTHFLYFRPSSCNIKPQLSD